MFRLTSHRSLVTGHPSLVTSHQSPVVGHQLPVLIPLHLRAFAVFIEVLADAVADAVFVHVSRFDGIVRLDDLGKGIDFFRIEYKYALVIICFDTLSAKGDGDTFDIIIEDSFSIFYILASGDIEVVR